MKSGILNTETDQRQQSDPKSLKEKASSVLCFSLSVTGFDSSIENVLNICSFDIGATQGWKVKNMQ